MGLGAHQVFHDPVFRRNCCGGWFILRVFVHNNSGGSYQSSWLILRYLVRIKAAEQNTQHNTVLLILRCSIHPILAKRVEEVKKKSKVDDCLFLIQ